MSGGRMGLPRLTIEEAREQEAVLRGELNSILYGDLEQMTVETFVSIDHPSHEAILQDLGQRFGPDKAAEFALRMALIVEARMKHATTDRDTDTEEAR